MQDFTQTLVSEAKSDKLPEEYDYFGQLVGSWELDYADRNASRTVKSEWHFAHILEGMAIQDVIIPPLARHQNRDTSSR